MLVTGLLGMASARAGSIGRGDRYAGAPWASRSPVLAQHGMAATEQPIASLAAVEILKKGGSAVDAAIAANAVLGLMQPVLNGIGGDAFAIVYDPKTHKLYGYNGSGWSPKGRDLASMRAEVAAAYKKAGMKPSDQIPLFGSLPVTVPGVVDAWFALHKRFGKLPISEDLAPAIYYAKHGFPVTEIVSRYWKGNWKAFEKNRGLIEEFGNAKKLYLINGHTPRQGEVFHNPDLSHTLSLIAKGGRDAFYKGRIAHTMADYFKRIGGDLRYADFATFHGAWVQPQSVNYRGYDVYELPPNGQGFAALEMLNTLKGFDLKKMGVGTADTLTAEIESKRLAFADLSKYYADPRFYDAPMKGLLSEKYADQRRKMINLQHANPNIGPGNPRLFNGDTTDFETADSSGMMVSMIQSNYAGMGSGLVADGLGFMFQDRGALYSLHGDAANVYAARKRPFHTIIPAFVMKQGKPWLAFGVMGGSMQPQGHVQVLVNMIDFGMNVQEAGDAARWRHVGSATPTGLPSKGIGTVELESGFNKSVGAALEKRGYKVDWVPPGSGAFGGYEAIMYDAKDHVYWGASEMRKDGEVVGY
ncbi:gamma-glutamyltransferase family protein [Oleiagrimonas sp.]|uniref:gamma-glutamyltransferase family protein n=1 Tax=Oleiagrimonas sp. TaxID=2010330 RepID=UPI002617ABB3|nr:gamma-glutamyltransferase family protein [Oleiagrimonas sp.]MDA3913742.1 gamma-glutamyltransferase family protein [Oleiagrimonas sp.]